MDSMLNGSDGRLFVRRLSDLVTGRTPNGASVELTINPVVQRVAYEQLTRRGYNGAVVAIKPSTGEILAMASTPSYNPNRLSAHGGAEQEAAWNEYTSPERDSPLTNRAVASIYPPGSTFKLVVTAAALETGKPPGQPAHRDARVAVAGHLDILAQLRRQSRGRGDIATLKEALVRSCNTAFASWSPPSARTTSQAGQLLASGSRPHHPILVTPSTLVIFPIFPPCNSPASGNEMWRSPRCRTR